MPASVCGIRRFVRRNDAAERRRALRIFAAAACLPAGVYLSELFHFLEKPLFSRVYYGNLQVMFFAVCAAAYIFAFTLLFFRFVLKKRLGLTPFSRGAAAMELSRKAVLYLMTVIPILTVDFFLGRRFKLIVELGERITGMTALGNALRYLCVDVAAKTLAAVGLIFLVERGFDCLFAERPALPFGGIAAMLTFGTGELILARSVFAPLYFTLFLYEGILYLVSGRRFRITYVLALLLCVL